MEEASVLLANLFSTSRLEEVNKLALLYTALNKTKSMRLFLQKLRQFTESFKTTGCLLNYHYRWIAVYGLLNECFQREVDDTGAVSEILSCMEDFFISMHTEFLLLTNVAFLGGRLSSSPADRETARFLKYFLHHANEGRLKLYRRRFVSFFRLCSPYFSREAYKEKPRSILTLLQYGVRLTDRNKIFPSYLPRILLIILCALVDQGEQLNLWDGVTLEFRGEHPRITSLAMRKLCNLFQAVLSDTLNPHEAAFYLAERYTWPDAPTPELGNMIPFYDTLFPGCLYGRRNPSSLRHICRYSIRNALYDNWKLPDGIQSLPIPQILKDYVNLLKDL